MLDRRLQCLHELLFIQMLKFWRMDILSQILLKLLEKYGRNTTTLYPAAVIVDNMRMGQLRELL